MQPLICEHCVKAKSGIGCGYRLACQECVARSVDRSLVTFDAVRTRDVAELRITLERVLPAMSFEQSSTMVRAWWQLDHRRRSALPAV